jgi:hypothetical protein
VQLYKLRLVRAMRLTSVINPLSDTCLQSAKWRLVRATNHNFQNS